VFNYQITKLPNYQIYDRAETETKFLSWETMAEAHNVTITVDGKKITAPAGTLLI